MNARKKAIVLVSGGMDSAVTLALAKDQGFRCLALTFRYGQRHKVELEAAKRVVKAMGAGDHRVINLDPAAFGQSALTGDVPVPKHRTIKPGEIPATYVPARNTIFLAYALGLLDSEGADAIFIGVNALDYSGYPDCRPEYIAVFQRLANLATRRGVEGAKIVIHAPLIEMSKAGIVREGIRLKVDFAPTVSCYDPDTEGRACGACDACTLRRKGFEEAGVKDPTRYRP